MAGWMQSNCAKERIVHIQRCFPSTEACAKIPVVTCRQGADGAGKGECAVEEGMVHFPTGAAQPVCFVLHNKEQVSRSRRPLLCANVAMLVKNILVVAIAGGGLVAGCEADAGRDDGPSKQAGRPGYCHQTGQQSLDCWAGS